MIFWISAFLDLSDEDFDAGADFWTAVTGYAVSGSFGERGEFASLVPPEGDVFLRAQRLADGPSGMHVDVHTDDLAAEAERVVELGARPVVEPLETEGRGHIVFRSPGGLTFCLVTHPAQTRPPATDWGGQISLVDQVCLDIPASAYATETAFWSALVGQEWRQANVRPEFGYVVRPDDHALRFLTQRLVDDEGPVRAHLDIATDDLPRELDRHLALGAEQIRRNEWWVTLRDPLGREYCITSRHPSTGTV